MFWITGLILWAIFGLCAYRVFEKAWDRDFQEEPESAFKVMFLFISCLGPIGLGAAWYITRPIDVRREAQPWVQDLFDCIRYFGYRFMCLYLLFL
jgi:hypothetical protein